MNTKSNRRFALNPQRRGANTYMYVIDGNFCFCYIELFILELRVKLYVITYLGRLFVLLLVLVGGGGGSR